MLVVVSKVKEYAKSINPDIRVSKDYLEALSQEVESMIKRHIEINKDRKTLKGDLVGMKEEKPETQDPADMVTC